MIYARKVATGLQPRVEWREDKTNYGRFLPCRGYRAQPLWGTALPSKAFHAWLLLACPSGTKAILPSKHLRIILALIGALIRILTRVSFEAKTMKLGARDLWR